MFCFQALPPFLALKNIAPYKRENTDDFYFKLYRGKKRVNEQYIMKF